MQANNQDAMIYTAGNAVVYQGQFNGCTLRVTCEKGKPARVVRVYEDGSINRRLNRGWQEIIEEIKKQVNN